MEERRQVWCCYLQQNVMEATRNVQVNGYQIVWKKEIVSGDGLRGGDRISSEIFKKRGLRPTDLTVGMGRMIWIKEKQCEEEHRINNVQGLVDSGINGETGLTENKSCVVIL